MSLDFYILDFMCFKGFPNQIRVLLGYSVNYDLFECSFTLENKFWNF